MVSQLIGQRRIGTKNEVKKGVKILATKESIIRTVNVYQCFRTTEKNAAQSKCTQNNGVPTIIASFHTYDGNLYKEIINYLYLDF